jgi:nucleotide-binding universal stress UspA family protein
MRLQTILCPVDFSDPSHQALQQAAALAAWYGAKVIALHVHQPALAAVAALAGGGAADEEWTTDFGEVRDRIRVDAAAFTDASVELVPDVSGGEPADAIVAYAQSVPADLIVMGTRGKSGLQHLMLGSVTENVLRKAGCPVLTLSPRLQRPIGFPFQRVLCATDFSAASVAALGLAASLTRDVTAEVVVLHVNDEPDEYELFVARPFDVHRHLDARDASAAGVLAQFAGRAFGGQRQPTLRVVRGNPGEQIARIAAAEHADLVVMGAQGHNAVQTMLFGSTTNTVVRTAECPVLTTRR